MALAMSSCICTDRQAWMQLARTPAVAVHGISKNTHSNAKAPVRELVLAGASQLAHGVPSCHKLKSHEISIPKANGTLVEANEDLQPSL